MSVEAGLHDICALLYSSDNIHMSKILEEYVRKTFQSKNKS